MILFLYAIIAIYSITIILLLYGFSKMNDFESSQLIPRNRFTIIVPFRDEFYHLPILLDSFSRLNYPIHLFEVILVDDESTETFSVPDLKYTVSILKNNRTSNSPKKDAITTAIEKVKTDWIITIDADCVVNENWLATFDNYIQNYEVSMIVGAVSYTCNSGFLHQYQQFDFTSLQGATIGSFGLGKGFICNGANFAYTKSFFKELNGFNGNDQIASGDDVFLLQKAMSKSPEKVHYLKSKNTIVLTSPLNDWKSLFYQRVRWVSKTCYFESGFSIYLGFVVLSTNLIWILVVFGIIMGSLSIRNTFLFFVIKFVVEQLLIQKTLRFLSDGKLFFTILNSLFYPFFCVSIALYSIFGRYEWKGRKFK
jgi:cellulose synthase/poly-beta-1,6-N-acetylglucosamine synthase-like glycosyltransferase